MPIRPDLRHLYRGPEYAARRARIASRAGQRCEFCHKPHGAVIETVSGKTRLLNGAWEYWMFWRTAGSWHDRFGRGVIRFKVKDRKARLRTVKVICQMAHLDHNSCNNDDSNLKFLCGWCHLNHDKPHHQENRSIRMDSKRELLAFLERGLAAQQAVDAIVAAAERP